MIEQEQGQSSGKAGEARRWVGGAVFLVGLVGTLAFFAFFPGLPHVIDWGAVLASLAVATVARWCCLKWVPKRAGKNPGGARGA
ncbi:hypothetical protein [Streptomyces sp. NPDC047706]|uniref:hypothetical protein n=1 Tax=Streptomyces sp. NPDC047706 TaxID=3365486 RepID=UPI00370FDB9F